MKHGTLFFSSYLNLQTHFLHNQLDCNNEHWYYLMFAQQFTNDHLFLLRYLFFRWVTSLIRDLRFENVHRKIDLLNCAQISYYSVHLVSEN